MTRQPTLAQRKFIKEYLRTGSPKKAAQYAYPNQTPMTQLTQASFNIHKSLTVKRYLNELLDAEGLSDAKIAKKLNLIVEAGTSKRALKKSSTKDALSAINIAVDLKDLRPAKKIEQKTASISMNLDGKTDDELQQTLQNLQDEIRSFSKMVEETKKLKAQRVKEEGEAEEVIEEAELDLNDPEVKKNMEAL